MKQTITLSMFRDAFQSVRPDNFSYEGLEVLFDWFIEMEESGEPEFELDVIGICCGFSEQTDNDIAVDYQIDVDDLDDDDRWETVIDYLNDNTIVCGQTDTTIIYQDF